MTVTHFILNQENVSTFKQRISHVQPDAKPTWGKLSASGMIVHLRFTLEASLGDFKTPDKSNLLTRTLIPFVFFHIFTSWPKGKLKAPDHYTPTPNDSFETEQDKLNQAIDRFLATVVQTPARITTHEIFGPLTLTYWQRVHGLHFHHHLKQFGV